LETRLKFPDATEHESSLPFSQSLITGSSLRHLNPLRAQRLEAPNETESGLLASSLRLYGAVKAKHSTWIDSTGLD